jgi:hypothetical protein
VCLPSGTIVRRVVATALSDVPSAGDRCRELTARLDVRGDGVVTEAQVLHERVPRTGLLHRGKSSDPFSLLLDV